MGSKQGKTQKSQKGRKCSTDEKRQKKSEVTKCKMGKGKRQRQEIKNIEKEAE